MIRDILGQMGTHGVHEFRSETSPTVLYACQGCGYTALTEDLATWCCTCSKCDGETKGPGRSWCDECRQKDWADKEAKLAAKALAATVVADDGGPVFVPDLDRYFSDSGEASDYIYDEGMDPPALAVHPCNVVPVEVACFEELIEESWASHFDDPDGNDVQMSKKAHGLAAALRAVLEAEAPKSWVPRTDVRIVLPPMSTEGVAG